MNILHISCRLFSAVSTHGDMFVSHSNSRSISVLDAYPDFDNETCPVMGTRFC